MFGKNQYQGRHAANSISKKRPASSADKPVSKKAAPNAVENSQPKEQKPAANLRPALKKKARRAAQLQSVPFYAALTVVTVIAWLLPLRPTASAIEKRNLASFPSFSTESLFAGEYFQDIETWFSDTFTFREFWINISHGTERLHGIKTVVISGNSVQNDAIPVVNSEVTVSVTPSPLPEPEILSDLLTDEEGTLQMSEEQIEEWKGIVITADEYVNKASVLQVGSSTFEYPSFSKGATEQYASLLNTVGAIFKDKLTIYSIPAPCSATYMLSRVDREKYELTLEEDAIDYCGSLITADNVICVNAVDELTAHNNEYLAFRTDPHWTAVGAYYAYVAWCKTASIDPVPLADYTEDVQEPFYGTYYYNNAVNQKLLEGDKVYTYTPPGDVHLYLDFNNRDSLGVEYDLITKMATNDKYLAFLTGDSAKATFINNDIEDDSACVVYKTSFGNPFVYYLTQHFHTVYVIDIRSYSYRTLSSFISLHPEVKDVILLNSFSSLQFAKGNQSLLQMLLK